MVYADNVNPAALLLISNWLSVTSREKGGILHVLEFGCNKGSLGHQFTKKSEQTLYWHGVDCDKDAIALASTRLSATTVANLDDFATFDNYDCLLKKDWDLIVMVDLLEHLCDPSRFMKLLAKRLPKSSFCFVLPNIASMQTWEQISHNDFQYADTGIFDRTHKYFFTPKSSNKFFARFGLIQQGETVYLEDPVALGLLGAHHTFPKRINASNYSVEIRDEEHMRSFCSYGFGQIFVPDKLFLAKT